MTCINHLQSLVPCPNSERTRISLKLEECVWIKTWCSDIQFHEKF